MTTTPDVQDVTDALLAMLRAACSFRIGDGEAPGYAHTLTGVDQDPEEEQRYGIVYHVAGGNTTGDVARLSSTRTLIYQFTGVGERRDQAQWPATRMLQASLAVANPISPATSTVMGRWHTESGGCTQEGVLWNAHEKVALMVSV